MSLPAQVRVGQLSTDLTGTISGGYTGDYGSGIPSDHAFTAAGIADLTGNFYNPNFLSFDIQPFYNQSRTNSDFQSIIGASGVTASTSIFGGSNFPGSISYSKIFDSSGNFGVPGIANFTSHGESDTLNIGWSEHLANLPAASVSYQQGSSESSLYGASSDIDTRFRGVTANLNYLLAGFLLTGGDHYLDTHLELPQFLGNGQVEKSESLSNSYSVGIGHKLPFRGSFSASANRSDVSSDYSTGQYHGTLDNLMAGVTFNPIDKLHVGANVEYNDNLLGTIYQSVISAGGILPENIPPQSSHALDITGYGNYDLEQWHVTLNGTDEHREERFLGSTLMSDAYTGTATYNHQLYGGLLNATGGITRTTVSPSNQSFLGFIGLVNYVRPLGRWTVAGSVNYNQNAQTLLITYTTNSYGYSGSLSRKFQRTANWALIANGAKTEISGGSSSSFSQNYSTAITLRRISGSAAYSKSSGNSILTASGLSATSLLLPVLTPSAVVVYGGTAYSAAVGATPFRGFTLSASYSRAISNTVNNALGSNNKTEQLNARLQYLVRKVYFQAGYLRFEQSLSISGAAPVNTGSFYVGLSRWFNFF